MTDRWDKNPDLKKWVSQQDVDYIDEAIGEIKWQQLKTLRANLKAGQSDIAEKIGVSVPTYSKIENGKQIPNRNQAMKLAEAFGYGTSILELAADLDEQLRQVVMNSGIAALDRLKKAKHKNYELEAEPATMKWTSADVKMTVNRKRIPHHKIVDTPKVFSIEPTVQIIEDEADLISTPPMLVGIEDAFALTVPNHLMHPAYGEGDIVYVHTGRLPQNGDDVVVRIEFEDREIAFIRSVWDTNCNKETDGLPYFFDLISYYERDAAKMAAVAQVGDPNDLGKIVDVASEILRKNVWTLTGTKGGTDTLAGTGIALPKIINSDVHPIVGCQRKMGNPYGQSKFGEGPFS